MDEYSMISGTWVNTYNGEIIKVVNTIIDGDKMIIITNKGQQLSMEEFSNNYIQSEDLTNGNNINIPLKQSPVLPTNNNEEEYYDQSLLNKPLKSTKPNIDNQNLNINPTKEILDKFFNKIDIDNKESLLNISINTDLIPLDKLKIIIEYMDLSLEDISNYMVDNIINKEHLSNMIKNYLELVLKS